MSTDKRPPEREDQRRVMLALLGVNTMIRPIHEWLEAEYRYFVGQGYAPEHARAMSAASYMTVFGYKLPDWEPPKGENGAGR